MKGTSFCYSVRCAALKVRAKRLVGAGEQMRRVFLEREEPIIAAPLVKSAAIERFEWPAIDYGGLEEAVAQAEQVVNRPDTRWIAYN